MDQGARVQAAPAPGKQTRLRIADNRIPLGLGDEHVTVGDHIAYLWTTPGEFRAAVGFLEIGFDRDECCVLFGPADRNRQVCEALAARGYDCATYEAQEKLVILSGRRDASRWPPMIARVLAAALARGAPLIRVLGNIAWGRSDWPSARALLRLEARVTTAAKPFPCVVMCMYDVACASGSAIVLAAFATHPVTFFRNVVRKNRRCLEVEEFLARNVVSEAS